MKTLVLTLVLGLGLISSTVAKTPLHEAAKYGNLEQVQQLLSGSANNFVNTADETGFTPLMYAAKIGDTSIISLLTQHGAEVDTQNSAGATALMLAAKYGHEHAAELLLNGGASRTLKTNNGFTALKLAKVYGHDKLVNLLTSPSRRTTNS